MHPASLCFRRSLLTPIRYLRSVSEVNPDALSIATDMDDERAHNKTRGQMHGIPFVVKDNYYTNDKHNTSEGSLVLLGGRYVREATVVSKLRQAGGVLLGHSTMSEAADIAPSPTMRVGVPVGLAKAAMSTT